MLRLIPLKTFIPAIMEELFFSALTGSVQIDNIIPYILRMETAEYNLQMTGQTGAAAVAGISGGVGVPALHDPSAPNQPASVPVLLESSQPMAALASVAETASVVSDGMMNNANNATTTSMNGDVRLVNSGVVSSQSTNMNNPLGASGIQRAPLLSEAGQVLTLYADGAQTQSTQHATST